MEHCPNLEIVSTFGVGYSHVDVAWAGAHNVTVTNTPDVLTEEVADTAMGLLLSTVRELPQAERHLRAGQMAASGDYRLQCPATLRDRTVGMVGMGSIGQAIARRLDAFKVPVVYHTPQRGAGTFIPPLSEPRRHGARRRYPFGDRAWRPGDEEYDQRRDT